MPHKLVNGIKVELTAEEDRSKELLKKLLGTLMVLLIGLCLV
jgi:hypothetical protein